ncbi:MAG TPA: hypothetical protein VMH83_02310, partial [Candidatus Acidoferrum sp.]|nr:hypothetical protein [Candidatus Acidoferrum sp.]
MKIRALFFAAICLATLCAHAAAPPTIAASFNPTSIVYGDFSTLTITFSNTQVTAANLTADFVVNLDPMLKNAKAPQPTSNCLHHAEVATADAGTATLTSDGSGMVQIPAQSSCFFSVRVVPKNLPPPNMLSLTVAAGTLQTDLGNNPDPATATLNVSTSPPTVAKQFTPAAIVLGDNSVLTITLNNTDHTAATLLQDFTDNFPLGLEAANPANPASNCIGGGAVTATPGGDSVTLPAGVQIPQQSSCFVSVRVTSNDAGVYMNTIDAGTLQTDLGNSPADASDTLAIASVTPTVAKQFSPSTIMLNGSISTLQITLQNGNHRDISVDEDLVDTLPSHVRIASPANASTNCAGGVALATPGSSTLTLQQNAHIPAQSSCLMTAHVIGDAPGSFINTIPAGALHTDVGNSAASASATLNITAIAPTMTKAFAPTSIVAGTTSTLTLTLANANAVTAQLSASLADTFPNGLVVANPSSAATTCANGAVSAAPGGNTVALMPGAQIPANGSCTVTVSVAAANPASYANSVGAGALQTSLGASTSAANASLTVTTPSGDIAPTLTLSFEKANIAPNGISTLTIALHNA